MDNITRMFQSVIFAIGIVVLSCSTASAAALDPLGQLLHGYKSVPSAPQVSDALTEEQRLRLTEASSAFENGDFFTAERGARALVEEVPDAPEGWYLMGLALANMDRFEEAVEALNHAGQIYELNGEPFRIAGDIRASLGQLEAARLSYAAALEKDPENWRAGESLGLLMEQAGDLAGAKDVYAQAIEGAPAEEILPKLRLAVVEIQLGEVDTGIDRLLKVMEERPELHEVRTALVEHLIASNRVDDAADLLVKAAAADPENAAAVLLAARAELAALRVEDAKTRLYSALVLFGDDPIALSAIGAMLGAARDYPKSAEAFTAGLKLEPDSPALLRGLRNSQFRAGQLGEAFVAAETLSGQDDATSMDALWLGFIAEANDDTEVAEAAYRTAMQRDEGNWVAVNNLAAILVKTDPAEAIKVAQRAVAVSENAKQAQVTLGLAYLEAGDASEAVAVFAPLASAPDASARTIYRHGLALILKGDEVAGREEFARALKVDPDFEEAAQAKAVLESN